MKRIIYILFLFIAVSCWSTADNLKRDSSLAGSVELFESYFCDVDYSKDGTECLTRMNQIFIERISRNRAKISIDGCFTPSETYSLSTNLRFTGTSGDVEFDGEFLISLKERGLVVYEGPASVSGHITNNTYIISKGTPVIQDLDVDIRLEFTGNHKYSIHCHNVVGPYPEESMQF